jgi:hypothetical protein
VQPQQQQVVPRARGREYKRHADLSVVLTLVDSCGAAAAAAAKPSSSAKDSDADGDAAAAAAADETEQQQQQQQQQQQPDSNQPLGGDYDGPEAVELQLSGIPDLPPDTIGPPSPIPGSHSEPAAAAAAADGSSLKQQLSSKGSGLQQQQQQGLGQQGGLQQLGSRHSSASMGLELLEGGEDSVGPGGMKAGGSAELQQSE